MKPKHALTAVLQVSVGQQYLRADGFILDAVREYDDIAFNVEAQTAIDLSKIIAAPTMPHLPGSTLHRTWQNLSRAKESKERQPTWIHVEVVARGPTRVLVLTSRDKDEHQAGKHSSQSSFMKRSTHQQKR